MYVELEDIGNFEVTVVKDGDKPKVTVNRFGGDFWGEALNSMLRSSDPNAPEVISNVLLWLESEGVDNELSKRTTGRTDDSYTVDGGSVYSDEGSHESVAMDLGVNTYLYRFALALEDFKRDKGQRLIQAMAGNVPILIYKAIPDTYCFAFPPSTIVLTKDDVLAMQKSGKYSFGKRYMDKLVEVLFE